MNRANPVRSRPLAHRRLNVVVPVQNGGCPLLGRNGYRSVVVCSRGIGRTCEAFEGVDEFERQSEYVWVKCRKVEVIDSTGKG